jgi:hypothetical protein
MNQKFIPITFIPQGGSPQPLKNLCSTPGPPELKIGTPLNYLDVHPLPKNRPYIHMFDQLSQFGDRFLKFGLLMVIGVSTTRLPTVLLTVQMTFLPSLPNQELSTRKPPWIEKVPEAQMEHLFWESVLEKWAEP